MVAILGRSKWDWGKGDVFILLVGDSYFAQCFDHDDETEADVIDAVDAMDLLTRHGVRLTAAGRQWMKEQRILAEKFNSSRLVEAGNRRCSDV